MEKTFTEIIISHCTCWPCLKIGSLLGRSFMTSSYSKKELRSNNIFAHIYLKDSTDDCNKIEASKLLPRCIASVYWILEEPFTVHHGPLSQWCQFFCNTSRDITCLDIMWIQTSKVWIALTLGTRASKLNSCWLEMSREFIFLYLWHPG